MTERGAAGPVPITPRHVCLLFRRFTQWGADVTRPYVDALEARGIPHVLVGGKSFHQREEVETVRTALSAIEWPDDELSVFGALRGPLFAVGDEALLEYRHRVRTAPPVPRAGRGCGRAARRGAAPGRPTGCACCAQLHRRRNYRPVEETIDALLTATRAHAGFVLRQSGERALANVLRIAELARRGRPRAASRSAASSSSSATRPSSRDAAEAPIVEEGTEGVRIMTVHRAKGLEFPVVILADIGANIAAQNPGRHVDPERGLCALRLAGCVAVGPPRPRGGGARARAGRGRARGLRRGDPRARPARGAGRRRRPVRERMGGRGRRLDRAGAARGVSACGAPARVRARPRLSDVRGGQRARAPRPGQRRAATTCGRASTSRAAQAARTTASCGGTRPRCRSARAHGTASGART